MAKKFKIFVFGGTPLLVGTFLALTACGDDVTKVTEVTNPGLEVVASADSLGKCTEERSGEMKFASKENAVFVCADSAWKNVSAVENVSCFAEILKDSSGFKIVCDGDSVGVVFNGKDGKKGEDGKAGASCTVGLLSDSSGYKVVCDGDSVGTIRGGLTGEGCTLTDNGDGSVMQVCGADTVALYKAFCGGNAYDPDSSFCYEDSVVTLCGGEIYSVGKDICLDEKVYKNKVLIWMNMNPDIDYEVFTDARDGQVYRMVKIGEQTWMAENLNLEYTAGKGSLCADSLEENCDKFGRIYQWSSAMDSAAVYGETGKECFSGEMECGVAASVTVRGICPEGWHLPDTTEWIQLLDFVNGDLNSASGDEERSSSSVAGTGNSSGSSDPGFYDKNVAKALVSIVYGGNDKYGFGGVFAGVENGGSVYYNMWSLFHSSSKDGNGYSYGMMMVNDFSLVVQFTPNSMKYSIRCVKDEEDRR